MDSGSAPAATTTNPPCGRCGGPAEYDFATLWLCLDCYHVAGSTCAGIGQSTTPAPDAVC